MKTIIFSLMAVCFAIGLFAFAKPNNEVEKATIARAEKRTKMKEFARQQGRERFCITYSCAGQVANRPAVMNPASYSQVGCPATDCFGSVCVCAIYAFRNTVTGLPIISSTSDPALFNQLNDFAQDGIWNNSHAWVELKDE